MKGYNESHIRKAEIAQLILLYHIYAQNGSHNLIFQGGTALRWCYGGSRFSEDLDFVTTLPTAAVTALLHKALKSAEREMMPHFGSGKLSVTDKTTREGSLKLLAGWQSDKNREKVSIKLESEPLLGGTVLQTDRMIMSALPAVSYMVMTGDFRIPRPNSVLVVETPAEILSDKVRALLERPYIKGRDLFDVWLLRQNRQTRLEPGLVSRKLACYSWPFTAARTPDFFLAPESENALIEAMESDLSRFLPPAIIEIHRNNSYRLFLEAVRDLCRELSRIAA